MSTSKASNGGDDFFASLLGGGGGGGGDGVSKPGSSTTTTSATTSTTRSRTSPFSPTAPTVAPAVAAPRPNPFAAARSARAARAANVDAAAALFAKPSRTSTPSTPGAPPSATATRSVTPIATSTTSSAPQKPQNNFFDSFGLDQKPVATQKETVKSPVKAAAILGDLGLAEFIPQKPVQTASAPPKASVNANAVPRPTSIPPPATSVVSAISAPPSTSHRTVSPPRPQKASSRSTSPATQSQISPPAAVHRGISPPPHVIIGSNSTPFVVPRGRSISPTARVPSPKAASSVISQVPIALNQTHAQLQYQVDNAKRPPTPTGGKPGVLSPRVTQLPPTQFVSVGPSSSPAVVPPIVEESQHPTSSTAPLPPVSVNPFAISTSNNLDFGEHSSGNEFTGFPEDDDIDFNIKSTARSPRPTSPLPPPSQQPQLSAVGPSSQYTDFEDVDTSTRKYGMVDSGNDLNQAQKQTEVVDELDDLVFGAVAQSAQHPADELQQYEAVLQTESVEYSQNIEYQQHYGQTQQLVSQNEQYQNETQQYAYSQDGQQYQQFGYSQDSQQYQDPQQQYDFTQQQGEYTQQQSEYLQQTQYEYSATQDQVQPQYGYSELDQYEQFSQQQQQYQQPKFGYSNEVAQPIAVPQPEFIQQAEAPQNLFGAPDQGHSPFDSIGNQNAFGDFPASESFVQYEQTPQQLFGATDNRSSPFDAIGNQDVFASLPPPPPAVVKPESPVPPPAAVRAPSPAPPSKTVSPVPPPASIKPVSPIPTAAVIAHAAFETSTPQDPISLETHQENPFGAPDNQNPFGVADSQNPFGAPYGAAFPGDQQFEGQQQQYVDYSQQQFSEYDQQQYQQQQYTGYEQQGAYGQDYNAYYQYDQTQQGVEFQEHQQQYVEGYQQQTYATDPTQQSVYPTEQPSFANEDLQYQAQAVESSQAPLETPAVVEKVEAVIQDATEPTFVSDQTTEPVQLQSEAPSDIPAPSVATAEQAAPVQQNDVTYDQSQYYGDQLQQQEYAQQYAQGSFTQDGTAGSLETYDQNYYTQQQQEYQYDQNGVMYGADGRVIDQSQYQYSDQQAVYGAYGTDSGYDAGAQYDQQGQQYLYPEGYDPSQVPPPVMAICPPKPDSDPSQPAEYESGQYDNQQQQQYIYSEGYDTSQPNPESVVNQQTNEYNAEVQYNGENYQYEGQEQQQQQQYLYPEGYDASQVPPPAVAEPVNTVPSQTLPQTVLPLVQPLPSTITCVSCAHILQADSLFCNKCGTRVAAKPPTPQIPVTQLAQPTQISPQGIAPPPQAAIPAVTPPTAASTIIPPPLASFGSVPPPATQTVGTPRHPRMTRSRSSNPGQVHAIPPQPQQFAPPQQQTYELPAAPVEQFRFVDPLGRHRGHAMAMFSFGGQLVYTGPQRYQRAQTDPVRGTYFVEKSAPGKIKIANVQHLLASSFPEISKSNTPVLGSRNKLKKKDVVKIAEDGVSRVQALVAEGKVGKEVLVLWKLVKLCLEADGVLLSGKPEHAQSVRDWLDLPAQAHSSSKLDEIQAFLLKGDKSNACRVAVDAGLWTHALVISAQIDKDTYRDVVSSFSRNEFSAGEVAAIPTGTKGDRPGLRVLYSLFGGAGKAAVAEFLPEAADEQITQNALASWQETLALILSNKTPGDSAAISAFGDQLSAFNLTAAAHICFLLSPSHSLVSGVDAPNSKIVLLGANHVFNPSRFTKDFDSLHLTEVYEYSQSLINNTGITGCLPHLQAYKLCYAHNLAEVGLTSQALHYCEAIEQVVRNSAKASPYFHKVFIESLRDLMEHLSMARTSDSSSNAGGKIELTKKLSSFSLMNLVDGGIKTLMSNAVGEDISGQTPSSNAAKSSKEIGNEKPSFFLPPDMIRPLSTTGASHVGYTNGNNGGYDQGGYGNNGYSDNAGYGNQNAIEYDNNGGYYDENGQYYQQQDQFGEVPQSNYDQNAGYYDENGQFVGQGQQYDPNAQYGNTEYGYDNQYSNEVYSGDNQYVDGNVVSDNNQAYNEQYGDQMATNQYGYDSNNQTVTDYQNYGDNVYGQEQYGVDQYVADQYGDNQYGDDQGYGEVSQSGYGDNNQSHETQSYADNYYGDDVIAETSAPEPVSETLPPPPPKPTVTQPPPPSVSKPTPSFTTPAVPPPSSFSQPPPAPTATQNAWGEEEDDLGFGNKALTSKPLTQEPVKEASTPTPEPVKEAETPKEEKRRSSSWFSLPSIFGGGKSADSSKPAPVQVKLGESMQLVFDPVQKKWVHGKTGDAVAATNTVAPPPKASATQSAPTSRLSTPTPVDPSPRPASGMGNNPSSGADAPQFGAALGGAKRRGARNKYVDVMNTSGKVAAPPSSLKSFLPSAGAQIVSEGSLGTPVESESPVANTFSPAEQISPASLSTPQPQQVRAAPVQEHPIQQQPQTLNQPPVSRLPTSINTIVGPRSVPPQSQPSQSRPMPSTQRPAQQVGNFGIQSQQRLSESQPPNQQRSGPSPNANRPAIPPTAASQPNQARVVSPGTRPGNAPQSARRPMAKPVGHAAAPSDI
ncbi:vesicle coat component [Rhizoclosmatium sp. JEL0117]|nr:vesicle coat component [Rhizoclosmatium sp. JEL0117]